MIDEREIWACANEILRQFGDAAAFHSAQRAEALLASGDLGGQRTWLRILARVNDLKAAPPPSSQLN
jgi:hypothetical protein